MQANILHVEVVFSSDAKHMQEWMRQAQLPVFMLDSLCDLYACSHPWLQSLKKELSTLFLLEMPSIWCSSSGLPADIVNLVQCLVTGVATLVFEESNGHETCTMTRGLPPRLWIDRNKQKLREVFGDKHYWLLRTAYGDTTSSFRPNFTAAGLDGGR
ncbi:hypothetical protein C8J57DRAFT_1438955 [Mycena rebaudengoi]|nr:hypothetical protein C8J57DRAFT_1438955 [Mycena rebaudengoi]